MNDRLLKLITKDVLEEDGTIHIDKLLSQPNSLDIIGSKISDLADKLEYDYIIALDWEAIPLATYVSIAERFPWQLYQGNEVTDTQALLISTVCRDGKDEEIAMEKINYCSAYVCVLDTEEGGFQRVLNKGIKAKSIYTLQKVVEYRQKRIKLKGE